MELIDKNTNLLEKLSGSFSLISAQIMGINIFEENQQVYIDVKLKLLYTKICNIILLRFIDVKEYSFYYQKSTIFYFIEIYKFFAIKDDFYVSFDPVDEMEEVSDEDQDFILAQSVEGYFLN